MFEILCKLIESEQQCHPQLCLLDPFTSSLSPRSNSFSFSKIQSKVSNKLCMSSLSSQKQRIKVKHVICLYNIIFYILYFIFITIQYHTIISTNYTFKHPLDMTYDIFDQIST